MHCCNPSVQQAGGLQGYRSRLHKKTQSQSQKAKQINEMSDKFLPSESGNTREMRDCGRGQQNLWRRRPGVQRLKQVGWGGGEGNQTKDDKALRNLDTWQINF